MRVSSFPVIEVNRPVMGLAFTESFLDFAIPGEEKISGKG